MEHPQPHVEQDQQPCRLVLVRGPSGAGKSTTSSLLAEALRRGDRVGRPVNVVLVEADHVRRQMLGDQHNVDGNERKRERVAALMEASTLAAWRVGVDVVIIDGLLNVQRQEYREGLHRLRKAAEKEKKEKGKEKERDATVSFYLDVPFEETVRRHATRSKSNDFDADEMATWWNAASRYALTDPTINEVVIPASSSTCETVKTMVNHVWGVTPLSSE